MDEIKKTILVIGYVWPEPNSSAAGSHMMSLLRLFKSQEWRVVFATPAQKTDHMVNLSDEQIDHFEIKLNDESFDSFVAELSPNYVMFDRFMMEEQFGWRVEKYCPQAIRILDTEDLQSLRSARQTALKENRQLSDKDLSGDLAKRELAAIWRSDLSLIISDYELGLLKSFYGLDESLLCHLPFMLDPDKLKPQGPSFSEREHFITIGNFRHAPNWDSVLYLKELWPNIRAKLPDAELHIYGSYPAKKATQLHNPSQGFLVKGWAEDALAVISRAKVCLSPLRFGAGIKGKLLDAMRVNTPSVTTSIGAEGMHGELSWPGLVVDKPEAIVEAAVELYQNRELWHKKIAEIPPLLNQRYDGVRLGQKLIAKIIEIENNIESHRQKNFIGAMLKHHNLKSTMYMSKWIEEKTKNQNSQ